MSRVIYFVRHGETDWNAEARLQGQRDIPLNGHGRVQAEEVGRRLGALLPRPDARDYVASPLGRTRETMEIVRRTLGLPPERYRVDPRWAELTFGSWEGLTWREVRRQDGERAKHRERDKWNFVPPDGESYAMLVDRIAPALDDLADGTVLVSHGGVARALLHLLAGEPEARAPMADIWQGRLLVFEDGGARWH